MVEGPKWDRLWRVSVMGGSCVGGGRERGVVTQREREVFKWVLNIGFFGVKW